MQGGCFIQVGCQPAQSVFVIALVSFHFFASKSTREQLLQAQLGLCHGHHGTGFSGAGRYRLSSSELCASTSVTTVNLSEPVDWITFSPDPSKKMRIVSLLLSSSSCPTPHSDLETWRTRVPFANLFGGVTVTPSLVFVFPQARCRRRIDDTSTQRCCSALLDEDCALHQSQTGPAALANEKRHPEVPFWRE